MTPAETGQAYGDMTAAEWGEIRRLIFRKLYAREIPTPPEHAQSTYDRALAAHAAMLGRTAP